MEEQDIILENNEEDSQEDNKQEITLPLGTTMSKINWDLKTNEKEIASHLQEYHCYPFNDRRALTVEDFIFEHFPVMVKNMSDKEYGYLSGERRKELNDVRKKLVKALKICEEKCIPIAKVLDFNEEGEPEWRVCKPSKEQLAYLKFNRWFASAEGYFNKAYLQENMLGDIDVDIMIEELKNTIIKRQTLRQEVKIKKETKKEIN